MKELPSISYRDHAHHRSKCIDLFSIISTHEWMAEADPMRLDDLYHMTAYIYGDRNSVRAKEATFTHFVEVCGMLTVYERKKKRESFDLTDALCKALGWYFPLLAKLRIRSVENLIFRKYPSVCPYCRKVPHEDENCKLVIGTADTVNHEEVVKAYSANFDSRPDTLDDWQAMFQRIYPRNVNESGGRSTIALMEELGELAEAVRVFDMHPEYFLGEAADTFSYLMAIANEHKLRERQEGREFSFEAEYLARYPGLCMQCESRVCACPAVPSATIGRMAKELDIGTGETPFITDLRAFDEAGRRCSQEALERLGGYPGLTSRLPFDRGDAHHALVQLCLQIAELTEDADRELASSLRAQAIRLGESLKQAGSPSEPLDVMNLIEQLRSQWRQIDEEQKNKIKSTGGIVGDLGEILDSVHVLVVLPNPESNSDYLNLYEEQRAITKVIEQGSSGSKIAIDSLPAARVDDLRNRLLISKYDIVHFSGHADEENLYFDDGTGQPQAVPLKAVANLINQYESIKCVIMNACESAKSLKEPMSPITIGMMEEIEDQAAIEFSRGFYDALANGKSFERSIEEGKRAVELASFDSSLISVLVRS